MMISPDYCTGLDATEENFYLHRKDSLALQTYLLTNSKKSETSKTQSSVKYSSDGMMSCLMNRTIYLDFSVGDTL